MIVFWIATATIGAAAAALMAQIATSARLTGVNADPAQAVYRRQLAELDDLADRGLIPAAELAATRTEASRRLLRAADAKTEHTARQSSPAVITAAVAAPPLLALIGYLLLGSPGYDDQPYAQRLAAWRAADPRTLGAPQMAAILRSIQVERPNDTTLLRNLAIASLAADDPNGAVGAMRRAVTLAPRDASLWLALGEALLMQNQNRPSTASTQALNTALRLQPGMPEARYALARGQISSGDLAGGLAGWRALLSELPATDARRPGLALQISQVSAWGGLSAPAASDRSNVDDAIRGMVAGLAARLQANPNDPQGWIRLVRAYAVLGETQRRDQALAQARARYAGSPEVLRGLDEALRTPAP